MSNRNSNLTRNLTRTFPEPNPNTMDYLKLHEHIGKEHDVILPENELNQIVRFVTSRNVLEKNDIDYKITIKEYCELYNYMVEEHGIPLLMDEMQEVVRIVLEMHNEKPETCTTNESTTFYSKLQMADILRGIKESQKYGTKYIYLRKDYDVIGYVNPLTDEECEAIGAEFMFKLQTIK